ncbi:hypothetical protein ABTH81_19945, partial [Acinetobacter baumannii]
QRVEGAEGGGNLGKIHDSNRYKGDNSSVSQINRKGRKTRPGLPFRFSDKCFPKALLHASGAHVR